METGNCRANSYPLVYRPDVAQPLGFGATKCRAKGMTPATFCPGAQYRL
jgi:hypothetical protein